MDGVLYYSVSNGDELDLQCFIVPEIEGAQPQF